ncbi:MAG: AI-2E family transporter [Gloeomargarita sp. SKYB31]|nr:AI-2E family transporter [Gloeomargarita sp. SKYB31]
MVSPKSDYTYFNHYKNRTTGAELAIISLTVDQIVDNVITPRILGNLTGLNPVWVLLSLLISSQAASVVGVLLAVPLAGLLKRIFAEFLQAPLSPKETVE